jgi:hypothetical protein
MTTHTSLGSDLLLDFAGNAARRARSKSLEAEGPSDAYVFNAEACPKAM